MFDYRIGERRRRSNEEAIEQMPEIQLNGCRPTPLASYLKGLGVMKLVSRHWKDSRTVWNEDGLTLTTNATAQEIERYLLHDYCPTPMIAPWNGGSGFYRKDNNTALEAICAGKAERLAPLRESITIANDVLADFDRSSSPKGADKTKLLQRIRAVLSDDALEWFDAAILLASDGAQFPPLLGTGGNDGRLDFTNNFMQRLTEIIDSDNGSPTTESESWLRMALFGEPAPGLVKKAIGQFAPGQVGGPNASTGFDSDSAINPWDFVLMLEGSLLFAAAAVRRYSVDEAGTLSYPFTVRATAAGAGNVGRGDAASSRGELWLPLWSRPAEMNEIRALLAEGRVTLDKRPAKDALDFVRAVHRLAGYRGVDRFQRFGLLMRSGKAYLATPLNRVRVTADPDTGWIDDLERDDWLARFRRFTSNDSVPNRFAVLRQQLENSLFEIAQRPPMPAQVQNLLAVLGDIQYAMSSSRKAQEALRPVPRLQERWVRAADDGSTAFRIARALAGLRGVEQALPLRSQLFPVHPQYNDWMDSVCSMKGGRNDPTCRVQICTGWRGSLVKTLNTLLTRRLWLAGQLKMADRPLHSSAGVGLDDLGIFLGSGGFDRKISELMSGLSLCRIPEDSEHGAGANNLPSAVALLKLCMTPESTLRSLHYLSEDENAGLPVPPALLPQLRAGNRGNKAIAHAWRRLHSSGLTPIFEPQQLPKLIGVDPVRAAAAMLIPLRYGATSALARSVLEKEELKGDAA